MSYEKNGRGINYDKTMTADEKAHRDYLYHKQMKRENEEEMERLNSLNLRDFAEPSPLDYNFSAIEQELIAKVKRQEENALIYKLKEDGLFEDFLEDPNRRFKNFLMEKQGNKKTIYYNDGSIEGQRVITFETIFSYEGMKVTVETKID